MVIREILDELSAIEKAIGAAMKYAGLGQYQEVHRKLESGLRRVVKTKLRIRACCKPPHVAAQYSGRKAA